MNNTGLEELSGDGMPLFSRLFVFTANQRPKILKALDDEAGIIQEHDGVHFINSVVFKPGWDMEKNLDGEFKNLVDSVLEKH